MAGTAPAAPAGAMAWTATWTAATTGTASATATRTAATTGTATTTGDVPTSAATALGRCESWRQHCPDGQGQDCNGRNRIA
jgi:hypothetical protein